MAAIPRHKLLACIRCGIAPAMRAEEGKTYWGTDVDPILDEKTKLLVGYDDTLSTIGKNTEDTQAKEEASKILRHPDRRYMNARQTMLWQKKRFWNWCQSNVP